MKRTGVLLLAVAPLLAATACLSVASDDSRGPDVGRVGAGPLDAEVTLADPAKKELAQQIVASAENGTLDWRSAYGYVEDIGDGQGYTAGVIGFCTGTHDLLTLVEDYTRKHPDNALAPYLPALREVDGTDSHEGLDPGFPAAWKQESKVAAFRDAQDEKRDDGYFAPALRLAVRDGLGLLGQFVYYDAMVYHGPGSDRFSLGGIRAAALRAAASPAEGGDEKAYLNAFLDARRTAMLTKRPGVNTSRVDTAQRRFLDEGNLDLRTPLEWKVYGDTYKVP
ncbi:chitosanase [Streptomyces sp. WI04-05B]|uniref:chitosanase n=1 Tax=Streptomyces TaxID=1883 RepID=UPI0029ABA27A|nr:MULTISPECIES: chitosanase [unclassified Streptomyces]MDX2541276.1 chitosanase [Streptomyces sp. WI04-05B]MDX2585494.1 chitosanase [Streptomyces sp. WI04-05A]MDX3751366.1 chitosanase [Streptomyces sp. AK08-02]